MDPVQEIRDRLDGLSAYLGTAHPTVPQIVHLERFLSTAEALFYLRRANNFEETIASAQETGALGMNGGSTDPIATSRGMQTSPSEQSTTNGTVLPNGIVNGEYHDYANEGSLLGDAIGDILTNIGWLTNEMMKRAEESQVRKLPRSTWAFADCSST